MSIRTERVNSELQRVIANILNEGIKGASLSCMVSVLNVDVAPDLKHADVFLSIYGSNEKKKQDFDLICSNKGYIKKEMAIMLKSMRVLPELHFHLDDRLEYGDRISRIINDLNKKK